MSGPPPAWARRHGDRWRLAVRVQPGAARTALAGTHGEELKVRVAAPANEGKANEALTRFLADQLDVARGQVVVVRGATNRSKVVEVPAGADIDRLAG